MRGRTKLMPEPRTIFEKSVPGRVGCNIPLADTPEVQLQGVLGSIRDELELPEVSELEVIRHFTNLSHIQYGIDTGFYPLGSCTMKYNPRINERTAALPGFTQMHPLQPESTARGCLEVILGVHEFLQEITGFDAISMQPVAGAHGEFTCLAMIKAFQSGGRSVVLVPDSAHGTNPATASMCGFSVRSVATGPNGSIDLEDLKRGLSDDVAAFMVTNPSTLGLFERNIREVCELVHQAGGQVFCDGANMNAMVGVTRPGDHGFDCMHLNLHKTFSTPHGGGGPGCGAIAVKSHLAPYLPAPVVTPDGFDHDRPKSIGRVSGFHGQFLMAVRALTYLLAYGREELPEIARHAVLNANYVMARLREVLPPAYDRPCMHECVLTAKEYKKHGVRALDISKRLIDYGFHPPTNYFPLIVPEAMMIEPTETECKRVLDEFCDALIAICDEARTNPDLLRDAPQSQVVTRLDEARAVRQLDVKYDPNR